VTARALVIGIGESAAGDDGVGWSVLDRLRTDGVPAGVDLLAVRDPSEIVDLLAGARPVILVDAIVGARPGEVLELLPDDLAARGAGAVSTHGVGVLQAIDLARVLNDAPAPAIRIVGIAIDRPTRAREGLSPPVAAAVVKASERVRALLGS
jgi:hydrogenase maturation protease